MASNVATVQFICDQADLGKRLAYRKMFGEYALYLDGKVVALICDDQLFLKPTPEGRTHLGSVVEAPPYPGAKNFFLLSSELEDPDRLAEALRVTARALPEPRPKPARSRTGAAGKARKRKASK
jgi:TfoX/Sxy family transcriptional regulator of competence genes